MRGSLPADSAAETWSVHFALLSAQTGFSLFPIFGKLALATIPATALAAMRVVAAAILLGAFARIGDRERIARSDRPAVLLYALLGISFNQVLYILGLSLTSAINTAILTATIPVFTLLAAVILRRETMTGRAVAGLFLAGAGALVLLGFDRFDWHRRNVLGDLLLLGNAIFYSFYLVLSRAILVRYRARTIVSGIFSCGALPIVLFALPSISRFQPTRVTRLSWECLAAVVVFCTVMPYLANAWALARTHASRVAAYVFLQPLVASVLAVLILGERFSVKTAAAAALILGGLAVSIPRGEPKPMSLA